MFSKKKQIRILWRLAVSIVLPMFFGASISAQEKNKEAKPYLNLTKPRHVLSEAQGWEGNQFPHTMSVLEWNKDGFRYWGWYGLNEGRGIGLARSNDLIHWTKYAENPLLTNARWPSVVQGSSRDEKNTLYFALTRDYDKPSSYIVLASSRDGIHLKEERVLVAPVANQRNQNPNLFRDPKSGEFYLTYYRGNDKDSFEIVSRKAASISGLQQGPEKVLLKSTTTIAAPTLLYVDSKKVSSGSENGTYYLATEIYPNRYTDNPEGEWQVKVFSANSPDGDFVPVAGNPVLRCQRACLFQNIFNGKFYGFDCHLENPDKWILEEVEADLL